MHAFYANAVKNNLKFFLVFDLLDASFVSLQFLREATHFFEGVKEDTARLCYCSFVLMTSDLGRTMLQIALTLYSSARPVHVCSCENELKPHLRAHDVR